MTEIAQKPNGNTHFISARVVLPNDDIGHPKLFIVGKASAAISHCRSRL
jgi:hypothetical protein